MGAYNANESRQLRRNRAPHRRRKPVVNSWKMTAGKICATHAASRPAITLKLKHAAITR